MDLKQIAFDKPTKSQVQDIIFIKKILLLSFILSGLQILLRWLNTDQLGISFCFELPLLLFTIISKNQLHDSTSSRVGAFSWLLACLFLLLFTEVIFHFFEKSISIWLILPSIVFIIRLYALIRGYKLLNK